MNVLTCYVCDLEINWCPNWPHEIAVLWKNLCSPLGYLSVDFYAIVSTKDPRGIRSSIGLILSARRNPLRPWIKVSHSTWVPWSRIKFFSLAFNSSLWLRWVWALGCMLWTTLWFIIEFDYMLSYDNLVLSNVKLCYDVMITKCECSWLWMWSMFTLCLLVSPVNVYRYIYDYVMPWLVNYLSNLWTLSG